MNRPILHGLTALSLALGACASPPVHYHTLLPALEKLPTDQAPAGFLIDVLAVGIPAQLDQPQLVVRQGPTGIAVLDGERWAGPLGEELRDALSAELVSRLKTRDIAGLARPAHTPVLRLKVQIRRLDAWPGHKADLEADWALGFVDEAANARLVCSGRFETPVRGGYPELVLGQQRNIAALAERIATHARNWERSRTSDCSRGAQRQ
ncbi:PqiC family protein [Pseudomonas aeruginosa]|uniref:PqiC family protein n=1 Tax=Pseudomonas aeruginosa TaxID=287 RepID=UPI002FE38055